MPRVRRRGIGRRTELTHWQYVELLLGPGGSPSYFLSDADRRHAWEANRDTFMAEGNSTTRSWAYWEYEQRGLHLPYAEAVDYLDRNGLLSEQERADLARWRHQKAEKERQEAEHFAEATERYRRQKAGEVA